MSLTSSETDTFFIDVTHGYKISFGAAAAMLVVCGASDKSQVSLRRGAILYEGSKVLRLERLSFDGDLSTPEEFQLPVRVCVCKGANVLPCLLSCRCWRREDRPPFGDLGCALRPRPTPVLWSHPGVAPWLPHEGLANGEGGRGRELLPPDAALRQAFPFGEHRRKVEA